MQLIWFNPRERVYHTGEKKDYELQRLLNDHSVDLLVLDRLEDVEIRVANKIVDRLNKAYTYY
jgi:hypothetical protein